MKTLWIAVRVALVTAVLTGLLYPLVVTGAARTLWPAAASGSLVTDQDGRVVGSHLIGQGFARPAYFHPRPSAAGAGHDAASSSGSNLAPTSAKLRARVLADVARLRADDPEAVGDIPVELITASASGLDPHLSPAAALWQVPRIARARGIAPERLRELVLRHREGRDFGILGEPRVNVLRLNLALDEQFGTPAAAAR